MYPFFGSKIDKNYHYVLKLLDKFKKFSNNADICSYQIVKNLNFFKRENRFNTTQISLPQTFDAVKNRIDFD